MLTNSFHFLLSDPKEWTTEQAHLWLRSTIQQFKLPPIPNMEKTFPEDGQKLSQLSEEEFIERCPQVRFHWIMHERHFIFIHKLMSSNKLSTKEK